MGKKKGFEILKENYEKLSYFNSKYILEIQNYLILNYEVQKQIVKNQKYLNMLFRNKGWILNQNQCCILKFPMADFQRKNRGRGLLFLLLVLFLRGAQDLLLFWSEKKRLIRFFTIFFLQLDMRYLFSTFVMD